MSIATSTPRATPLKIRVGFADDLTTMPVVYGMEGILKSGTTRRFQTIEEVRRAFTDTECEVALLPAADVLTTRDVVVIPCSCAATLGASRLIMLFSKKLPTEIKRVLVDKEDLGGAPLAQLMMGKKLGVRPEFVKSTTPLDPTKYDMRQNDGFDAYLLAGKHSFLIRRDLFAFTLDMTLAWYEYTRMPFVLHAWVMRKGLKLLTLEKELGDVAKRNEGNAETSAKTSEKMGVSETGVRAVYEKALVTNFDGIIAQALRRYGQELSANRILPTQPVTLYAPAVLRKV